MTRLTGRLALALATPPILAANSPPPAIPFEYWDVFTGTRFTGNPLAVFTPSPY